LICKNITNLGLSVVDKTLRFSKPWQDCSIISNGKSKESQMSSLRKKIFEHKKSDAHLRAVELHKQSKEKQIEKSFENALKSNFSTTEKVFRTVYKIVKTQRPFVDLPNEIDLQVLNGINMGNILHSDKTCADIALHIASEIKKIICQNIILTKTKISILIDESTTLSKLTTLVVVVRAFIEDFPGEPYTFNLDLIELPNTSAETITKSLLDCLNGRGFDQIFLNECFIAFACDGASVMIGIDSGVAITRLKIQFPKLIIWHCSNHRLELAVGDVVGKVSGINHFKIFMDKL